MLLYSTVGWIHLSIGKPGALASLDGSRNGCYGSAICSGVAVGTCRNRGSLERVFLDLVYSCFLVCWPTHWAWRFISIGCCLEIRCRIGGRRPSDDCNHPRHAILGHASRRENCAGRNNHCFGYVRYLLPVYSDAPTSGHRASSSTREALAGASSIGKSCLAGDEGELMLDRFVAQG